MAVTTVNPGPDLAPAPIEIQDLRPERVIEMRPADQPLNGTHSRFVSSLEDTVANSGRVIAIYPSSTGDLLVLRWEKHEFGLGPGECMTVAAPADAPSGWSCGGRAPAGPNEVQGYMQSTGPESHQLLISHSRDAVAVVIELRDGKEYLIRPNGGQVSMHQWRGEAPVGYTVFWEDGTSTSESL